MTDPRYFSLPVDAALPELCRCLEEQGGAVLEAPPGAGKSTRVPLALLDAPWRGDDRILVLEPRRNKVVPDRVEGGILIAKADGSADS